MDQKYYLSDSNDDSRFVKIVRIIFGFACIGMALYWTIFNLRSGGGKAMWVTIIFILAFGMYQVWSGLGKSTRFIILGSDYIILKQHSLRQPLTFQAAEVRNIEIHPLSIIFFFKSGKKTILRLGAISYETNENIAGSIAAFSDNNSIPLEVKEEKIF